MREPGNLVPRHFFFARHFLCKKEKCLVNFVKQQKKCLEKCGSKGTHVLPGNYYEKMKSAWKKLEVKDLILPGTCYEKMISAWDSAGVKDIFWPDTIYDKMKSACKNTEVKDIILQGTCYEKMKSA